MLGMCQEFEMWQKIKKECVTLETKKRVFPLIFFTETYNKSVCYL